MPPDGAGRETRAAASIRFSTGRQQDFAALSGDHNPMHMDPVAARRTPAGACVVHGVQSLLWAIEQLAGTVPLEALTALDADFAQFLYVGETATLIVVQTTPQETRCELRVGEMRVCQFVLTFGARRPARLLGQPPDGAAIDYAADARVPLPLSWAEVVAAHGTVACAASDTALVAAYPRLAEAIGAARVRSLLLLTRLVGMVSPGLHSTFHRLSVRFVPEMGPPDRLHFVTLGSDARFAVVTIGVLGPGLCGQVKASRRQPPTPQPASASLRAMVAPDRFRGHTALVIGGSRGLGEVTAKLLALGGARVIVSYATGHGDAHSVVDDIAGAGGAAEAMAFDALRPASDQLAALPAVPDSLYFFATPRISRRGKGGFSSAVFLEFSRVYVDAFAELCAALSIGRRSALQVFYPSTVFVGEPTRGMAEYAMAKAAGEILAADMTAFLPGVEVETWRLPRLPTDQTASMMELEVGSAAETMLPILDRVEARVRHTS